MNSLSPVCFFFRYAQNSFIVFWPLLTFGWLKIKPFFSISFHRLIQVTSRGERTTMVLILLAHTAHRLYPTWIKLFFFTLSLSLTPLSSPTKRELFSLLLFYCVHKGISDFQQLNPIQKWKTCWFFSCFFFPLLVKEIVVEDRVVHSITYLLKMHIF